MSFSWLTDILTWHDHRSGVDYAPSFHLPWIPNPKEKPWLKRSAFICEFRIYGPLHWCTAFMEPSQGAEYSLGYEEQQR